MMRLFLGTQLDTFFKLNIMDKKLYILSKILINEGSKVNDIVFESYPYETQFDLLPYLWRYFEYSGIYSEDEKKLEHDLLVWTNKYENIIIKF